MKSPLVFRIYKKEQIYVVKQFMDDDRVVIGHSPEVQIDLGSEISAIHCLVEKRGNQFFICDMGSEKGTFKDGRQILDEPILNGDSFQVGIFNILFFIGAQKPLGSPVSKAQPTSPPLMQKPIIKTEVTRGLIETKIISPKTSVVRSGKKGKKTFAPVSEFSDLKDYLKVGSGHLVEVIVCWQERILNTYHFSPSGHRTLGFGGDINVPEGSTPKDWLFLSLDTGVIINTTPEMKVEVLRNGEAKTINENNYKLQQSEVCFIRLINDMQLVVRFAPKSPAVVFDSPVILGSSELTGILAALIIAILASLLVSVNKPKAINNKVEIERIAQVVFTTPPAALVETIHDLPTKATNDMPEKAIIADQIKEDKIAGDSAKPEQKSQSPEDAGRATEAKPKDSKLKAKMFTSVKQGGSLKTGINSAANAQSKELDLKTSGLLGAFGEGGARSKLDQAYSGSGKLIGDSEKAGTSGFNSTRQSEDLGSKTKDTGAGGAGTATQGIGELNTKGRGGGIGKYGSGEGLGEKGDVQISAGGSEESFVGSIDKEAVRRAVKHALPQFKACYEREYRKNTKLAGKVVIKWDIDDQGTAKNAIIVKGASTINNESVEECVKLRMLGLKFPEAPAGTWAEISYPFLFEGPKF